MSCSQPRQPICSSDSCGDDLKVFLTFSEGKYYKTTWQVQNKEQKWTHFIVPGKR